jgi:hypothetical protein
VNAICGWIYDHLEYRRGSSSEETTADETLLKRAGICRDFSHLAIAFCRGLGIPARFVSCYAYGLIPPDFHAVFEAYLDDAGGRSTRPARRILMVLFGSASAEMPPKSLSQHPLARSSRRGWTYASPLRAAARIKDRGLWMQYQPMTLLTSAMASSLIGWVKASSRIPVVMQAPLQARL